MEPSDTISKVTEYYLDTKWPTKVVGYLFRLAPSTKNSSHGKTDSYYETESTREKKKKKNNSHI